MTLTLDYIKAAAWRLIDLNPQPAPRVRLLRDVLRVSPADPDYQAARQALDQSRHTLDLAQTQEENGTWGRFHTQDTTVRQKFITTEVAIMKALAIGLDLQSPILQRVKGFIVAHLTGQAEWSDRPEKHDNPLLFFHGARQISAANLALMENTHPLLDEHHERAAAIVEGAFASGDYRQEDEARARNRVFDLVSRLPGGFAISKYSLILLSATEKGLPRPLEDRLLAFLLNRPDGIYYLYDHCLNDYPPIQAKHFSSWFATHEMLSRFAGWPSHAAGAVEWILHQRREDGLWDFGAQAAHDFYFPISDSWRYRQDRVIDSSTRVLALLRTFVDGR